MPSGLETAGAASNGFLRIIFVTPKYPHGATGAKNVKKCPQGQMIQSLQKEVARKRLDYRWSFSQADRR